MKILFLTKNIKYCYCKNAKSVLCYQILTFIFVASLNTFNSLCGGQFCCSVYSGCSCISILGFHWVWQKCWETNLNRITLLYSLLCSHCDLLLHFNHSCYIHWYNVKLNLELNIITRWCIVVLIWLLFSTLSVSLYLCCNYV